MTRSEAVDIEVTEEEAEDFVATLEQAGIRTHTTTELGADAVVDIYENDRLHSEIWRTMKLDGKRRISLTIRGRHQRLHEQDAARTNPGKAPVLARRTENSEKVAGQIAAEDLEPMFNELVRSWSTDTAHLSSPIKLMRHPAYQRIIGFGPPVLPLILRDLAESGRFWFPALNAITGENPVPDDAAGDIERMTSAWVEWGRENGLA